MPSTDPGAASMRPAMTAEISARTGLDEAVLADLVRCFYGKVREDIVLGPIFATRISDWEPHLARMTAFWSSVALMTGRYHGAPVPAHAELPVDWPDFERWLALFRQTASEVCSPAGAAHLVERAERIALSLHMAIKDAEPRTAPALTRPREVAMTKP